MKKTILSLLSISLLLITACTKENSEKLLVNDDSSFTPKITLSGEEYMSIAYDNPKEISKTEVKTILENFIEQEYVRPKNQTRTSSEITLFKQSAQYSLAEKMAIAQTRSSEVPAYNIDCSISEFEFELGGEKCRAVVSTDERYPKVLAFMKIEDTGKSEFENYCENMPEHDASQSILNLTYEVVHNHLYEIEVAKESLRDKTLLKISQELNEPIERISFDRIKNDIYISDNDNASTRATPIDLPTDQILSGCWPLVEISWGNNGGENDYLPYYWGTKRVSVWQGVSTVAQMLSAIRPSMTIPAKNYNGHGYKSSMSVDWDLLTQTEIFDETDSERKKEMGARLMRLISDDGGFLYGGNGQWSWRMINYATHYNAANFRTILQKYIACNLVTDYDLNTIVNSLGRSHPVFIDTVINNYMFLADGYLRTRSTSGINSTYLHLKFSNDMMSTSWKNGYYLVNADSSLYVESTYRPVHSRDFKIIAECRLK